MKLAGVDVFLAWSNRFLSECLLTLNSYLAMAYVSTTKHVKNSTKIKFTQFLNYAYLTLLEKMLLHLPKSNKIFWDVIAFLILNNHYSLIFVYVNKNILTWFCRELCKLSNTHRKIWISKTLFVLGSLLSTSVRSVFLKN
jgi:hypothetical protein